ncbi:MAG: leucyl aminopeptidase [Verrucomicrobiota bacterium]|nr:leucyl aminopeptidase [Verrucomicrobiota bacterium]
MKITLHDGPLAELDTDALAWPLTGGPALSETTEQQINALRNEGEVRGKPSELTIVHQPAGLNARRLMLLGVGETLGEPQAFRMAAQAVRAAQSRGYKHLTVAIPNADLARAVVEGCAYGGYEPPQYKSDAQPAALEKVTVSTTRGEEAALKSGRITGEAVNLARKLVDTPANDLGPEEFAELAASEGRAAGLEVEVLDEPALNKLGAGSLLSVSRGSVRPPRLVRLAWAPANAEGEDHLFLVGKGVTFDTGGLSLKPAGSMEKMKYDMAGAATMLGAITALARLEAPRRVSCLLGLVENMPSGSATRPGDIVRAMNGKTIEVVNTDAEGRLVLADALTHAVNLGATHLIDAATLTGAVSVALGAVNVGLMANNEALGHHLVATGRGIGENFWPLPMNEEYLDAMKGDLSDLRNAGANRQAGTITAAKFLEQFVNDTPWAHLDIAGTANLDKVVPHAPKGASGIAVRTLVRAVEAWPVR